MRLLPLLTLLPLLISACNDVSPVLAKQPTVTPAIEKKEQRKPIEAWKHRGAFKADLLARYGHARFLNLFAAQIMQESNWKSGAKSWVGAYGCGQFMPATQGDAKYWARDLGEIDWGNCQQSGRASIRYTRVIFKRIPKSQGSDNWRYREAVKDYNRGMGWGDKERRLGFCVRRNSACDETVNYIYRIFGKYQKRFHAMRYGKSFIVVD